MTDKRCKQVQIVVIISFLFAFTLADNIPEIAAANNSLWLGMQLTNREILVLLTSSLLLTGIVMKLTAMVLLKFMNHDAHQNRAALHLPAKFDIFMRTMVLLIFVGQLTFCGWELLIYNRWHLQRYFMLDEILLMLPFVVLLLLQWYFFYPVNRFVRQYFISDQLASGNTNCSVWPLREYMSFQIRHTLLIVLIPIFFILALRDLSNLLIVPWLQDITSRQNADTAGEIITFAGTLAVFILAPLMLRYIWQTKPLPVGPLRHKLEYFCHTIKLSFRNILLWQTGHGLTNAAVTGIFSKVRYILMTDALLDNMLPNEIEAVCGHEAGHVKFHHIIFLVLLVLAGILWGSLFTELISGWLLNKYPDGNIRSYLSATVVVAVIAGVLFILWLLIFGWVSRRFERQADVYGAWATAFTVQKLSTLTPADTPPTTLPKLNDNLLAPRGVAVMCSALHKIASLNGIAPQRRSWRHSSIASRIALLQQLATSEGTLKRFMCTVFYIKLMILLAVVTGIAGWYFIQA